MSEYHGTKKLGNDECDEIETWRSTAAAFNRRLERIEEMTSSTHEHLLTHIGQENRVETQIIELLETYNGARFAVRAIQWLTPVAAACAALYLWAKEHIR